MRTDYRIDTNKGWREIKIGDRKYRVQGARPKGDVYTCDAWVVSPSGRLREVKSAAILDKLARIVLLKEVV
jgi:hypothetical protein